VTFPTIALCVASGLLLVVIIWFSRADLRGQNQPVSKPADRAAIMLYDKEKQQEVDLQVLIAQLSEDDFDIRIAARKRIKVLAEQSNENRSSVISELLKAVEMPAFKYQLGTASGSYLWAQAAEILGDLKSAEAIDLLISCLDCTAATESATDGYRHKPAVRALLGIGSIAIPKLSTALSDPNPQTRYCAALTLGLIGGEEARIVLSNALAIEPDPGVRKSIKDAIDAVDRGLKSN
jgi:HEAT repeat protein